MMASSAAMTSVRSTSLLLELQPQVEGLRRRPVLEDERLGRPSFGFRGDLARLLARHGPWPSRVSCSIERDHFLGVCCLTICKSNDLEEMSASRQRFRTSSGMSASASDSVIAVRDFPSRLARSSCV